MIGNDLEHWCLEALGLPDSAAHQFAAVSGDASFRRYFRLSLQEQSWIAVHAPPREEDNDAFVNVQRMFAGARVRVPAVLAWDREQGYLLLDDFGDRLLLAELTDNNADAHYRAALALLHQVQAVPVPTGDLPDYGEALISEELGHFSHWFLEGLMGYEADGARRRLISNVNATLLDAMLSQERCCVHRDYHSRNIMICPDGELGLIDFQDANFGPVTYDLVSLLRDCYIRWPEERIDNWRNGFLRDAQLQGRLAAVSPDDFQRWFDLTGLQRHLKVLGVFSRLFLRDGKPGYLKDMPLVMDYVVSVSARYSETQALGDWLATEIAPVLLQALEARQS